VLFKTGRPRRSTWRSTATALETSARIDTVVMDKTGTLTKGQPEVTDVLVDGIPEDELLALAGAVERESDHPLAQAVARHATDRGYNAIALPIAAGVFEPSLGLVLRPEIAALSMPAPAFPRRRQRTAPQAASPSRRRSHHTTQRRPGAPTHAGRSSMTDPAP
jgi:magnesium-transporting ATPase (P-type)